MTTTQTAFAATTDVKIGRWTYPARTDGTNTVRNTKRDGSGEWIAVQTIGQVIPAPEPTDTTAQLVTAEAYESLSPIGRSFMALVGSCDPEIRRDGDLRGFDFFDDGVQAHSGNWGAHMTWQASEALGLTRLQVAGAQTSLASAKRGLWNVSAPQISGGARTKKDTWWSLTELGARVAKYAYRQDAYNVTGA
jgi:hypothetical protein